MQQDFSQKTIPCIFCDIDGVLKERDNPLPRVKETIEYLRKPLNELDPLKYDQSENQKLPLLLLTNRGGVTRKKQIDQINKSMNLNKEDIQFKEDDILLNYSAFVPLFKQYQDKLILIIKDEVKGHLEVLQEYGVKNFITSQEYLSIYPYLVPLTRQFRQQTCTQTQKIIKERLNINELDLENPLQIHAIFIQSCPTVWEENIQLINDLLSTEDGQIAQSIPLQPPQNHIPIYCAYNDFIYKDGFRLPRFANGAFTACLKTVYKMYYGKEIQIEMYGKPELHQFQFAEEYAKEKYKLNFSNFYMIGDNPQSDIKGANLIGWKSILVRTGVFTGEGNDLRDPATYVVDDFQQAIKLIFQLENIQWNMK